MYLQGQRLEWYRACLVFDKLFVALTRTSRCTIRSIELTLDIVLQAEAFYSIAERADRLIAATAAELEIPLITRDPDIGRAAGVDVIW
jgi:PIN domain nuclease of toxin-antitoxin system